MGASLDNPRLCKMTDRRRINGPSGGSSAPIYSKYIQKDAASQTERPSRIRQPNVLRKMFLKTGVTPSASGSAYLELEASKAPNSRAPGLASLSTSGLKLTCTVHGPRPLPKNAPFSPHIILSTHVKYAPFATRKRRGYLRDSSERDLGVHLETALRGVIIGDRWPKSGVEVIITILEGEEDQWWIDHSWRLGHDERAEWLHYSCLSCYCGCGYRLCGRGIWRSCCCGEKQPGQAIDIGARSRSIRASGDSCSLHSRISAYPGRNHRSVGQRRHRTWRQINKHCPERIL